MHRTFLLGVATAMLLVGFALAEDDVPATDPLAAALAQAGENRAEIQRALDDAPASQSKGMRWLVGRMPVRDLSTMKAEYLLENCRLAYEAWEQSPWKESIDEELFFDAVLPYASVSEARERWRAPFRERFAPLVADAASPGAAAAILNNAVFELLGVTYSTKRRKPDQGPLESVELGLASCTGLTVLLIDACRAVGVPARFVGTPLWKDGSGNHSWVEVWDDGWHFTGAAEPTGDELDRGWFAGRAASATRADPRHGIYAVTWRRTPIHFPMAWKPDDRSVRAVDVTDRYTADRSAQVKEGHARVRFRVRDAATGQRCAAQVRVVRPRSPGAPEPVFAGAAKDERFDANDHLTTQLRIGELLRVTATHDGRRHAVSVRVEHDEQLVDIVLPAPRSGPR